MKKFNFPYIALGLGLFLMLVVYKGSVIGDNGGTSIPLLTLLAISEVAFFVTTIGAYIGVKKILSDGVRLIDAVIAICCALLAIKFLIQGVALWPH